MHRLFLFTLMLAGSVNSQQFPPCKEDSCSEKECPPLPSCENGRILKNVTECGCCHICLKYLKEGEACSSVYYTLPTEECGPALICSGTTCVPTECLEKKRRHEKNALTDANRLKTSFECDHYGNFEPSEDGTSKPFLVCINDVLCFCVDKDGKRIFGTEVGGNASMSSTMCSCSRDIDDFPNEAKFEQLPRCLPNGDYDPLQCAGDRCFCMHSNINFVEEDQDSSNLHKLSCYDHEKHQNNRTTPCLEKRKKQMERFEGRDVTFIGLNRIQCELDGTFSPLQCEGDRCYCVKRDGEKHEGSVKRNEGQKCRCLRDKELIQSFEKEKTKQMEKFIQELHCDGNYTTSDVLPELFVKDFMKH